eukprot:1154328-Pelagomonas_calceolata.AAC.4
MFFTSVSKTLGFAQKFLSYRTMTTALGLEMGGNGKGGSLRLSCKGVNSSCHCYQSDNEVRGSRSISVHGYKHEW